MYYVLAALLGSLITLTYGVNSRLSSIAGPLVATVVIHVSGLVGISLLSLVKREPRQPGRLPAWLYLGGLVGVGTVLTGNYAFLALPASLAVALALLGQSISSIAVDASGLLGRRRYPLTAHRIPGIALAATGAAVLAGTAGFGKSTAAAMLAALAAGALPTLSVLLNSELGRRKGLLYSTRMNYIVGLATSAVVLLAARPPAAASVHAVFSAGPFLALAGGLMGVGVVTTFSAVFARMPALSATLIVFCGQALTGVGFDLVREGALDVRKLLGTLLVLGGLGLNALLGRRREPGAVGAAESAEALEAAEALEPLEPRAAQAPAEPSPPTP
ncbi:MAG TPA: DMT family transporter [Spirochaetia bacterium]|nr:DMT family transporter [Spirochaetia bacterium]